MENNKLNGIDISFGPSWARQAPEKWVADESARHHHAPGRRHDRDAGGPGGRESKRFGNLRRRDHDQGKFGRRQKPSGPGAAAFREAMPSPAEKSPVVKIAFIPERRGLKPLVKQLAGTRRAYSLFEIASTCLSKPEFYAVIMEALPGENQQQPEPLFQCSACKAVFSSRQMAVTHGLARHLGLFYDIEETEGEPPQGNFTCVARCSLSGELLGPPNYHAFNEKLLELHRSRYATMPIGDYRKKIVNVTDPAAIEQWKKEAARKTTYRVKTPGAAASFDRLSQAESHFRDNCAATLVREGARFVIPATVCQELDDRRLKSAVQEAWQKETRFPINMAVAIQQRFRRLGLHIFRTPAKMTFVSSVRPHAIDPAQANAAVRNILEWIKSNSGKTRQDMVAALAPGMPADSSGVAGIVNDLVWLVDRGHVIEFMNGSLAVPNQARFSRPESRAPAAPGPKESEPELSANAKSVSQ